MVQLERRPPAARSALRGRVEHLSSGEARRFESLAALVGFLTRFTTVVGIAATFAVIATAQAVNPPGAPTDHFLAYKTKTTKGTAKFAPVKDVRLIDDFEDVTVDVKAVADFLVPVAVNGGAVVDDETHLRAYKIKAVKGSPKHVKRLRTVVTNHLGTLTVDTAKPDLLLVPTATAAAPPNPATHAVDHFKCYVVKVSKGTPKLPKGLQVTVTDPFTSAARVLNVRALKHLCLPVDKNLEGVENRLGDLACYTVAAAKGQPKHVKRPGVHVTNQFGSLTLDTAKESQLCVPSVAPVPTPTPPIGGPTTTPAATNLNTATPTPVSTAGLPPDPETVAPALDEGVASIAAFTTQFLYTGANKIQTDVEENAIDERRAAVLRGRALERNGAPLPGVRVTIVGHPELGQTLTRVDGLFDLVVNGGAMLTVDYAKDGFLPVQRQVDVPWQEFVTLPDVMLTQLDPQMTAIDLDQGGMLVARGSVQSDADGTRRTTLLFPAGTTATMIDAQGQEQPISQLSVRATEYTVGPNGPTAMPGTLPPSSAYTYAVELSVDEAIASGAEEVVFNQPVFHYVENFLDFPVGEPVPTGFYDRKQGLWVAAPNGVVIAIVSITGGLANLDTDGDTVVDDGVTLGVTVAERQQLASLYTAGQSLWRVPIPHFSTVDCNWPFVPPSDATAANAPDAETDEPIDQCVDEQPLGSVVECQNQILGESVAVVGTPFTLNYRSDRVPGHQGSRTVSIAASGASVPASLEGIEVELHVAGQMLRQTLPPTANQDVAFTWDGRDVYGRLLQGRQPFRATIGYVYDAIYATPAEAQQGFGVFGSAPISGDRTREKITIGQVLTGALGTLDARGTGLGGWTLSVHHAYDPVGGVVYLGNGRRLSAGAIKTGVTTLTGGGAINAATGLPAKAAKLNASPFSVVFTADGTLFFSIPNEHRIGRVGLDGVLALFGTGPGFGGDGQLLGFASFSSPQGLAVGPDGAGYVADTGNNRIRRVAPDGIIETFAGTGEDDFAGDDGPALDAALSTPKHVAVGPDGSIYVADDGNDRIRRIGTDGIINTIAGGGAVSGNQIDGINALDADLNGIGGLAVDTKGIVYFANGATILRIGVDGRVTRIAGDFETCDFGGDGGPARQATICTPTGLALDSEGTLYVGDRGNDRIRAIGANGVITSVAGGGTDATTDEVPAQQAFLEAAQGPAIAPDGSLHVVARGPNRIRRFRSLLPSFAGVSFSVASEDGGAVYQFDAAGRHLQTIDSLTGATIYAFSYDGANRLVGLHDGDGKTTTITRNGAGQPTAITGPFGQVTTLTLDANGFLASVTNPADETVAMTYTADGLLTDFTDERDGTSSYEYDDLGRLTHTEDPAGGSHTFVRTELPNGHELTRTSALGRVTIDRVERLPGGGQRLTHTAPDGTVARVDLDSDGTQVALLADGTIATTVLGPDPRFGMQAPVATSTTVELPSGLTFTSSQARTAVLSNSNDPLSLTSLTETATVNGRTVTRQYDRSANTLTETTPEGRQRIDTLDALRRVVRRDVPGLAPIAFDYDDGLLTSVVEGTLPTTRTLQVTYDERGYVERIDQPESLRTDVTTDDAGRVATLVLPGSRTFAYGYDAAGNVTSITPPGRPATLFAHDARNRPSGYTVPDAGDGAETTTAERNLDRRLTKRTLPGGASITIAYDATSGRLTSQTLARGALTYAYDAATGYLASITAPDGVVVAYETDGALPSRTEWSGPVVGSVERTHDADFRTVSLAVNGANPLALSYDDDGLVVGAGALTISRDAATSRVLTTALGDVTDERSYGDFEDLTGYSAAFNGTTIYDVQLTQDDLGRIVTRTETIGGVTTTLTYGYDAASRLADVKEGAVTLASYAYDTNGNRLSLTTSGGTTPGTYDAQDRLAQYGTTSFDYDAAGQLASKTVGGQTTTYDYDETGNLLAVTLPSSTVVEYLIDGANRRIGRKVNGTLTDGFLYQDRVRPIAALDGAGAVVSRFVYALPGTTPDFMIKSGATFRIVTDPLGSPRLVVNVATGAIAQRMDYDEFGNVVLDTSPGFQPFGFAGGLYDPTTGLVRFGVRDYDAATGRFTARDPALVSEESLYAYAANDPVNLVDRLGRAPKDLDGWLKDATDLVPGTQLADPLERKEAQVFESRAIRQAIDDLAADRRAIGLLRKLDDLAEFAAKKIAPPVKVCIFFATVAGLSERAEAADRNVVDQALAEQSPIEPETGAAAIRAAGEAFVGTIVDAVRGTFEDLFQRPF